MFNFSRKAKNPDLKDETTVSIGKFGEDIALNMLKKKGFKCLERNYHASHNEIDLIVEDKQRIVFVEVKARTYSDVQNMPYGRPARAVTYEKQRHLIEAAKTYIRTHEVKGKFFRFDVVEVYFSPAPNFSNSREVTNIVHMENAFRVS